MSIETGHPGGTHVRTLLILGASGDLTGRLLLPGLARLIGSGRATGLHLAGAGGPGYSQEKWAQRVTETCEAAMEHATEAGRAELAKIAKHTSFTELDVTKPNELANMVKTLDGPVALYFALPPAVSQRACEVLEPGQLPETTLLVMEKPFGSNQQSAQGLNRTLIRLVPEENIHRVDHFLGKGTVFNILGLRFANRLLEPLFTSEHVEKIEIFYDEELALEDRAGYYDGAGALRDMIQSHLLQILGLLTMNAPATLKERDVRDHLGSVLRATALAGDPGKFTRRARYTAGTSKGRPVPDYAAEKGVEPALKTETLAEVTLHINNSRWASVPFILRAGKALGTARKEAIITFRPVSHLPTGFKGTDKPTKLRIGFGPDTLSLDLDVNGPGDLYTLDHVTLAAELNSPDLLPYGEVLLGVLSGDPTLSVRGDTAEECWRIVDPILTAWADDMVDLDEYPAGGNGPAGWATNCTL
ncbi:glucose-6-phosphate dehydrogenase [Paeniglutamicibacter psychrophenolicus]|uniref:glucose-6-phosphate dehydrogenase n=1 Tax=Paeniglutamicibacter psychrophenolicus TaxID=257454 RepID=UPI0027815DE9|nr:glucose-6-phosphate dehydrogenase [Paeniglutamicibacter psychrophenolicus]MDQ0096169.1 glucose-6-phosphate 1-dehydrogenase [Paeniglutamicibacter psychrophenolicus]